MKHALVSLVTKLTASRGANRALDRLVLVLQYVQGIGSGSHVAHSGEVPVIGRILESLSRSSSGPVTVFDVGGNDGKFVEQVTQSMRESGRLVVHCFEPSSTCFESLSRKFSSLPEVRLNNVALGETSAMATLYSDVAGSGLASLTKRDLAHVGRTFERAESVSVTTLDEYCRTHEIAKIDILKIDVEGHELDVLHGSRSMFEKGAVSIVAFEFGGCNIDTKTYFRDFYKFFEALEMKLFRITPSGYLFPLDAYRETQEQFRTTNFVAVAKGVGFP